MADEADITSNNEEFNHLQDLYVSRKPEGPQPRGHCLNCGPDAELPYPMRWCDQDCQDDWQQRQRRH